MPRTAKSEDKRSRKDLELFVLALITRGIATTYDLKMSAAISPGASIPVLSRLQSNGLIKKGREGARNRQEYAVTAKGTALLENSWKELFQAPPSADLEVVLRIAALAVFLGEPKRSVAEYLSRASGQRRALKVRKPARPAGATTPGEVFLWMRQVAAEGRSKTEAAILRKLASAVRRLE